MYNIFIIFIFVNPNLNNMNTAVDTTFAPVTFTEGALKELLKLKDQQEIADSFGLRVGVEGGGCSGMS
jgi:iron-sulfur cluster assembly protein